VVDFICYWSARSQTPQINFLTWIDLSKSKFYGWKKCYGKLNEHNAEIPRYFWLEDWEKDEIIKFCHDHSEDGYRRICYMLMDSNIVAVSPSSVYRVLKETDQIRPSTAEKSKKGTGFKQPSAPHKHWHVDILHINISGTFYYLFAILDGYSRYIIHWELRESMKEMEVETIMQRARENFQMPTLALYPIMVHNLLPTILKISSGNVV
jgi:putative transposase